MRNVLLALLLLFCALAFGCSDTPAVAARRSIGKTADMLRVADAGFKQNTKAALEAVAASHRATTLAELAKLGFANMAEYMGVGADGLPARA